MNMLAARAKERRRHGRCPLSHEDFGMSQFKRRLTRLYNLSRPFKGVSLYSMDLHCLSGVMSSARDERRSSA